MWPLLIATTAGAGLGMLNAQHQQKVKKEEMMANAEQIKMSPWTGAKTQVQGYGDTPSTLMGAAQGGLSGAMFASQFGKAAPTPAPEAPEAAPAGGSALGGQQMSAQIGDHASQFGAQAQNSPWASPEMKQPSFWSNQYAMNRR